MKIADANIILRYLLNDHETFSKEAISIIEENTIHLPFEVLAEVVYVLEKVYNVPRLNIHNALKVLIDYPNLQTNNKAIFINAIEIFHTHSIDFVDSILIAYNHQTNATIFSFDKKLKKLCM